MRARSASSPSRSSPRRGPEAAFDLRARDRRDERDQRPDADRDEISSDVIEALEALLKQARAGDLIGIAYTAMYKRRRYVVDTAGECRRNPTFTRGMVRALDDRLAISVGSKPAP
jgi:hypothetical protein